MPDGENYKLNVGVGICFESNGPCILDSQPLSDAVIPKPGCLLGKGFKIQGDSFIKDSVIFS